ncbi:mechanosensitive ion channel family protein [Patescibacteria group bacterium]|nr:mechanosensitive ion channel family protein [Patescibacteria group bacterium]
MDFLQTLEEISIWSNTGYDYMIAIFIFFGLIIVLKVFQIIILSHLQKLALRSKTDIDDMLIEVFKKVKPPFYFFVALYFGVKFLNISELIARVIYILFLVFVVWEIIQVMSRILDFSIRKFLQKNQEDGEDNQHAESTVRLMMVIIKAILWVIGLLLVLSNLGINVTSLVAGMGIGGIAIALALQSVLSDLFSAFSIYIDKPFQVGDFIMIGSDKGEVEKIGLKTTRIRTLQGEQLVVSNQELTSARIQNFRRMQNRRVSFNLGVTYDTKSDKLEKIPHIIEEVVSQVKLAKFDRCHFVEYSDSALIFEVVFFINNREMTDYLNARQEINLGIYKRFAKEKIEFAYPTQTIHLQK